MKQLLVFLITFLLLGSGLLAITHLTHADELDDITKQIGDLTDQLNKSVAATTPLESQMTDMQNQIATIKNEVANIEADIIVKKKQIDDGYADMETKQKLLNATVREFYIQNYSNSSLATLLSAKSADELTLNLAYQQAQANQDKTLITNLALSITDLQQKKIDLENEETRLAAAKTDLDQQSAKLDTVIQGAKAYQSTLSNQIAQLSAKQQQLLAQKLASLNIPLYAYSTQGGCSSDLTNGKDPGFSPRFGLFTYGVPNRVGLNQYGALGRANAGQNSDTILRAYYNFDSYQNSSITINVNDSNGFNSGNIIWSGSLDDYVRRIYEVPDGWPIEALKAQAIAARSYAVAATNNGAMSICANQNCQVFQTNPKGGNWDSAVTQTAGQVMVQGGQVVKAWFSSTHGGYVHSSASIGWDSTSFTKDAQDSSSAINSFSDLNNNAYDKDSPWFYCDWGGRSDYANTAWLKPEELADIVNVILLAKADSGTQNHLAQTDKSNPDGVDTWDSGRVKQELKNRGVTPFNSISSASVNADFGSGVTTTITFNGDAGTQTFSGSDFKNYFNLRAPSNINIVGPLYNVEQR
ncbi:MAG TPA: SpoIID/LytB domain-containing protein [Patescibacteria group bacterium]|nr:SpoIID/LytB domain-containing protein [Patescibacteria group bacterium]